MCDLSKAYTIRYHSFTNEQPQAKTKAQISFAVTAKLINAFVFHYMDSTLPLPSKSKISSLYPSFVTVQAGLWQSCQKTCWISHEAQMFRKKKGFRKDNFTFEPSCEKTNNVVSEQVKHKSGCTGTETG